MSTTAKRFVAILILVCFAVTVPLLYSESSGQTVKKFTVKLYSENTLVATWEANGPGRIEGTSFVFAVGSEMSPRTVRINGTYSVEQMQ